jgi:hypothetical protein
MPRRTLLSVCSAALALSWIAAIGCKSSGESTTGGAGGPAGPAVPAAELCKELAQIACDADQKCCDAGKVVPPVMAGSGGSGGGGGDGGHGGSAPPPPLPPSCLSAQSLACDNTAGKLALDPRTGYDPARGGDFVAKVRALGEACWKDPIAYPSFVAAFPGTGALGADCTPDDTTAPSLRAAALSCQGGAACRLSLRADGKPQGTCEKRSDDACSHALDCPSGQWCDLPSPWSPGLWGSCRPLRANGWKCQGDLECESATCGFDGKCAPAEEDAFCLTRVYSSVVLADEPAAYYRLADQSGSAADASGHAHPGNRSGSPAPRVPGALAGDGDPATSFDGNDDSIAVSATLLESKSAFSLEGWLAPGDMSGGLPVLSMGDAGADGLLIALGKGGDTLEVTLVDTDAQTHSMASPPGTIAPGKWSHVVVSYDGSHGILWLDGSKSAELQGVFTPRVDNRLSIGVSPTGEASFSGGIDEVAVYGKALDPARVARHRQTGVNGPVVSAWRFYRWLM